MIGIMSSALARRRTFPVARPTEIEGSQVIPASTDLFSTRRGMSGPVDLKSDMSLGLILHVASAFNNSGYCCDPTPGKATVLPLRSHGDLSGEPLGTRIAVCSRILIATSVEGSLEAATTAGPIPADATCRAPAPIAWFSGAP